MRDDLKQIGMGAWSEVYQHPYRDDRVIKITNRDKGAQSFYKECLKLQGHPAIPVIDYLWNNPNKPGNMIVVMEKLSSWTESQWGGRFGDGARMHEIRGSGRLWDLLDTPPNVNESFAVEIANYLAVQGYWNYFGTDINNAQNCMVRASDGMLVVTDPFFGIASEDTPPHVYSLEDIA